jgi:hypothetical protein
MADKDRRPAVTPKADKGGRVEDRIRNARDSLPGMRNALPKGALGGVPTDPQGDENREPPAGFCQTDQPRVAGCRSSFSRNSMVNVRSNLRSRWTS